MENFFDETRVVQRQNVIELKSIYPVDPIRDIVLGNVTNNGTQFVLVSATGTNASLQTAERGPYPPGQEVEPGAAMLMPDVPVGGQGCRHGYFDQDNGWFFLFTASGLDLVVRRAGVDRKHKWGNWKGSSVEGVKEKFAFRPANGYVYHLPFVWYGFGPTEFQFQMKKNLNGKWMRTLGTTRPEGETSIIQPHLPLRTEVFNEAGDDPFTVYVTGRQVSIVGTYNPIHRETPIEVENVTLTATEWRPIVSIRRQSVFPYARTNVASHEVYSTEQVRLSIVEDGPVPSTGWTAISDVKPILTLLEQNLTGAGVADLATAGNLLGKSRVSGAGQGKSESGNSRPVGRTPLIEDRPMTIYGRLKPGAADTTLSGTFVFREEY